MVLLSDLEYPQVGLVWSQVPAIAASVRYSSGVGGLRVSCHYHNTVEQLDRLLECVREWRADVPRAT